MDTEEVLKEKLAKAESELKSQKEKHLSDVADLKAKHKEEVSALKEIHGKAVQSVTSELNQQVQLVSDLKKEVESLKTPAEPKAEEPKNIVKLSDGRKVEVHFGAHIPELNKEYTRDEILNNEEVISYLLEIGSGAVSIVVDPKKSK